MFRFGRNKNVFYRRWRCYVKERWESDNGLPMKRLAGALKQYMSHLEDLGYARLVWYLSNASASARAPLGRLALFGSGAWTDGVSWLACFSLERYSIKSHAGSQS